jgi:hypothetical protein
MEISNYFLQLLNPNKNLASAISVDKFNCLIPGI